MFNDTKRIYDSSTIRIAATYFTSFSDTKKIIEQ